jgi:hypothetical protein
MIKRGDIFAWADDTDMRELDKTLGEIETALRRQGLESSKVRAR